MVIVMLIEFRPVQVSFNYISQ